MIPVSAIEEWRNKVPWQTNEQVEQDLIICRGLKEIFKDNNFIYSGVVFRFGLVYLIAQILAIPDISNPTFWSWQFIALLYIDNNNLNKKK